MYRINVSLNGKHIFEAECRGANEAIATQIYEDMVSRYPINEGYRHTHTHTHSCFP